MEDIVSADGINCLPVCLTQYGKKRIFFDKDSYRLLLKCDGAHDFEKASLNEKERDMIITVSTGGCVNSSKMAGTSGSIRRRNRLSRSISNGIR